MQSERCCSLLLELWRLQGEELYKPAAQGSCQAPEASDLCWALLRLALRTGCTACCGG